MGDGSAATAAVVYNSRRLSLMSTLSRYNNYNNYDNNDDNLYTPINGETATRIQYIQLEDIYVTEPLVLD